MNIIEVEFYSEFGKVECLDDINMEIKNGILTVSSDKTKLRKIYMKTDIHLSDDVVVLGDAFERAYGDLKWEKVHDKSIPWYFLAKKENEVLGIGVKTAPNALCWWKIKGGDVYFIADIGSGGSGLELFGRTLEVCRFVEQKYDISTFDAACDFCGKLCDNPRLLERPLYGGNSWLSDYGTITYDKIVNHTRRIAECADGLKNRPYMVIDAGWQICYNEGFIGGPWSPNRKFGDMKKLADEIKSYDVIPGLWINPLETVEHVPEKAVMRRDGIFAVLDPSVPETLELIKEDIKTVKGWGYKLIKHDFTTNDITGKWGFEMDENLTDGIVFSDKTRTTAEIIKDMYQAIRDAAGDDVAIIGCNTLSHLSAGYFEIMRTGDDTSGKDFERVKKMGVNALAFRLPQHNHFYICDADCVGVTRDIPWEKNRQWLDVLSKSGTPLFVCIEDEMFTDEVKKEIKQAFLYASENRIIARPLDWEEKERPERWLTKYGEVEYCFN